MLESLAVVAGLEDVAVMRQPVEQCRGHGFGGPGSGDSMLSRRSE